MLTLSPNSRCWCGSGKKYRRCHEATDPPPTVGPGRVSDFRDVPQEIPRPEYVGNSRPSRHIPDPIKSEETIARMRRACEAARDVLDHVGAHVKPGITTDELDEIAHERYLFHGGYPSDLHYQGFPKSICTSINEVICHGIPDDRELSDGEIVSIDVTIYLDGVHGDCCATFGVGEVSKEATHLSRTTLEAMNAGIATVKHGSDVSEIGRAIERVAVANNCQVVKAFTGHGIGEVFHMPPQVLHYYEPSEHFTLEAGMTFTIEPMISNGTWRHVVWPDGWTAVTADRSLVAQYEHTVLVTETGVEILTGGEYSVPGL